MDMVKDSTHQGHAPARQPSNEDKYGNQYPLSMFVLNRTENPSPRTIVSVAALDMVMSCASIYPDILNHVEQSIRESTV